MSNRIAFLITLAIVVLIILGVSRLFAALPSFFYQSLVLLAVSTMGLYVYLLRIRENHRDFFVHFYLGSIALKLLAYGIYLFLIVREDRPGAFENVAFFMATYAVFTALEVGFLWRKISR
ncbi:MAG: hypothetical protein KF845_01390 [Cyclobacteriaceae bacterium]|nr:hypothetical protein [Cyclobacteriaceae bacterium]